MSVPYSAEISEAADILDRGYMDGWIKDGLVPWLRCLANTHHSERGSRCAMCGDDHAEDLARAVIGEHHA